MRKSTDNGLSRLGKNPNSTHRGWKLAGQGKKSQYREFFQNTLAISPEQSRAARAWLSWSQFELAKRAGLAKNTVHGFESGQRKLTRANIAALQRAIEAEGIRLLFGENGAPAGIVNQNVRIDVSTAHPQRRRTKVRRAEE